MPVQIHESQGRISRLIFFSEKLEVALHLLKGAEIYGIVDRRSGLNLLKTVPTCEEEYRRIETGHDLDLKWSTDPWTTGGWFTMFPCAGTSIEILGKQVPVHGDLRGRSFHLTNIKERTDGTARAVIKAHGLSFDYIFTRTIEFDQSLSHVRFHDHIENRCEREVGVIFGIHPSFGPPFCYEADVRIPGAQTPIKCLPESTQASRNLFIPSPSSGFYEAYNSTFGVGLTVRFDPKLFKHVYFLNVVDPVCRGYKDFLAIEPMTHIPNHLPPSDRMPLKPGQTLYLLFFPIILGLKA
jgi:hypothetical protein